MVKPKGLAIIAVGGNALILSPDKQSIHDQYLAAAQTVHHIAQMISNGWNVVITHGSGPQVGFILRRSELAIGEIAPVPMDYADADIQGAVGYMFTRALHNEFLKRGLKKHAAALVTQVLVNRNDPAFANPAKPIGPQLDEKTAKQRAAEHGWTIVEDAGRGWRRTVPSPTPQAIVELEQISLLANAGTVVIACGGGGIPVFEDETGAHQGAEAVVDKDLSSSLLARDLNADLFLVSTAIEQVAVNFNTPEQEWLDKLNIAQAEALLAENQFDPGSMGPKIEAMIDYLKNGGTRGIITDPANISRALAGKTGTHFIP
jgi:carbamate kinase